MILTVEQSSHLRVMILNYISVNKIIPPKECGEYDYDTVRSFYSQIYIRMLKSSSSYRINNYTAANDICQRFFHGIALADLAIEYKCNTSKIVKVVLENLHQYGFATKSLTISEFLEFPQNVTDEMSIKSNLIKGIESDELFSHVSDQIKECIGREYEELLIKNLKSKMMVFETEAELRSKGKPKTPDILFLIPMATSFSPYQTSQEHDELVVINWIDSKAMYADEETFEENREQFRSYISRYGRGMVIYWHGLVETILNKLDDDRNMLVVTDHFPDNWIFPTGEVASGHIPEFCKDKIVLDNMGLDY